MITKVCKDFKFLESIAKESFTEKVPLEEKPEQNAGSKLCGYL